MEKEEIIRRIDGSIDGWRFYEGVNKAGEQTWCYPSCTTIIDAVYPKDSFLIQWIREQGLGGQAIFEKAGEEGTEAHIAIDALVRGEGVDAREMSEKVKKCIQAFIDWTKEFNPKFLASEEMLASHAYKFAGTRDLLCELNYVDGKKKYQGIYCVDYKTSSMIHDKHKIQNAGYWACRKTHKARRWRFFIWAIERRLGIHFWSTTQFHISSSSSILTKPSSYSIRILSRKSLFTPTTSNYDLLNLRSSPCGDTQSKSLRNSRLPAILQSRHLGIPRNT